MIVLHTRLYICFSLLRKLGDFVQEINEIRYPGRATIA